MKLRLRTQCGLVLLACLALVVGLAGGVLALENFALSGTAIADSDYSAGYKAAYGNDGNMDTRWSTAIGWMDAWYGIQWATPKTFSSVVVQYFPGYHPDTQAFVEVWNGTGWDTIATVGDGVTVLPMTTTVLFPEVTASKVRVRQISTINELQVFNGATVTGTVTSTNTGMPIRGATMSVGSNSVLTDSNGVYTFVLDSGEVTVTLSKDYMYEQKTVTAAGGSTATLDFSEMTYNLAPEGIASASSEYSGFPGDATYRAGKINDDDPSTRWSAAAGDEALWTAIDWPWERTFNTVVFRQFPGCCQRPSLKIETLNSSYEWTEVLTVGDGTTNLPDVATIAVPSQTSMGIRVSQVVTYNELEVYNATTVTGVVTSAATGQPIAAARIEGGLVQTSSANDGSYTVSAPAGATITLRVTRSPFDKLVVPVTVPEGGTTQNLSMTGGAPNLALEATGAFASSSTEGHAPEMVKDNDRVTTWVGRDERASWVAIEWPTAKTVDTVQFMNGLSVEVWVDVWRLGGWYRVFDGGQAGVAASSAIATFTPRETTKIRIGGAWIVPELEVYNLNGPSPFGEQLQGQVTNSLTGAGLAGATVTVGALTTTTGSNGWYALTLPPGPVDVSVSRQAYDPQTKSATVPETGNVTVHFALTTDNIAPYGVASSPSTFSPSYSPANGNDDDPFTRWSAEANVKPPFYIGWPVAVTINRVKMYLHGAANWGSPEYEVSTWNGTDWVTQGTVPADMVWEVVFAAPVTTNKVRISSPATFTEVEVGGDLYPGGDVLVTGVITNAFTGKPLVGATVDSGMVQATSAADGSYSIRVAPNAPTTLTVTRMGYEPMSKSLTSPATGSAQLDFAVPTNNIAPFATASTAPATPAYPGYGANLANDDDPTTRFSFASGVGTYRLVWSVPVTLNRVKVYSYGDPAWSPFENWEVSSWSDETKVWTLLASAPKAAIWDVTFPPITTNRIRFVNAATFYEMEAHGYLPGQTISSAKQLPDGMPIQLTGSTTAVFSDAAYVEEVNRTSGIRVQPAAGFGAQDMMATVTGGLRTIGGERVLTASSVTVGAPNALKPLGLPNRSLTTSDSKLSTAGLLVTTWGKVVKSVDAPGGAKYLYVDDGSMVPSDVTGVYALKVGPVVTTAGEGDFVQATGIGRVADAGGVPIRQLCPRASSDIRK